MAEKVEVYKTVDGILFPTEIDAVRHEFKLNVREIFKQEGLTIEESHVEIIWLRRFDIVSEALFVRRKEI